MRSRPHTLPLGAISEATLRPEDIIPELLYMARPSNLRMSRRDRALVRELTRDLDNPETDQADVLDELLNVLDGYTPDYAYLGALEGDGACLGVWPLSDVLEGDYYRDECPRLPAGEYPSGLHVAQPTHFIAVSDHGNATLYRRRAAGRAWRWVEVWSVV